MEGYWGTRLGKMSREDTHSRPQPLVKPFQGQAAAPRRSRLHVNANMHVSMHDLMATGLYLYLFLFWAHSIENTVPATGGISP